MNQPAAPRPTALSRRRLAVVALLVTAYLALAAVALLWGRPQWDSVLPSAADSTLGGIDILGIALAFGAMFTAGLVILAGRPGHRIGLLLILAAVSALLYLLSVNYASRALATGRVEQMPAAPAAWALQWLWIGYAWTLLVPLPLLYPTGRLPSRRWRPVLWLALAHVALLWFATAFALMPAAEVAIANPFALRALPFLAELSSGLDHGMFVVALPALASLVVRYRASEPDARAQIRWLLFAVLLFALHGTLSTLSSLLGFAYIPPRWSGLIYGFFVVLVALAIAVAILRYHLYDIDLIIRRTLVYAIVTAPLVLFYLGAVVLLQALFTRLTGQGSRVAIALSTLAIAALFNPLRRRVQRWIDRRFYRAHYNAEQVVTAFAQMARDEADLNMLTHELIAVIRETLQPTSAALWLPPAARTRAAAGREQTPVAEP